MTMNDCEVTTPPAVEEGAVVFSVLHRPTAGVFRCAMRDFDDVTINLMPRGATPWPEGATRAEVSEMARHYASENGAHFSTLFQQLKVS